MTPQELVNEINFCYSEFDKIISKYNIEKIKTIGDSYMCAGGLNSTPSESAVNTVNAALEIRDFMRSESTKRNLHNKEIFEIRVGLHTGPVVAGIVGIKKFAYDIWGDTVNIAARMESSGEAGKVNVSETTFQRTQNNFAFEARGKIQAKNMGSISMYFVESK
jgi:class 3 adenylate cyclase